MYTRIFEPPRDSFFLFGPRGTGKSTWLRQHFTDPRHPVYDLLDTREALRLSKEPSILYDELAHLEKGRWVIIDEVQKVPALLDEVHRLIESRKLKFALSGSSARKLKRGGSNLLAGRAVLANMFPLVSQEVGYQIDLTRILRFGTLPMSYTGIDPDSYLRTYADVYLAEEIKSEALTRNFGGFSRFLEVAARQNANVTNVSSIARDAQVSRQTVQGYFDILIDTLVGFWLNPWKLKRATKQIAHPKFYFFDPGVVRALSGRLSYPPSPEEIGALFETFLFGEIRAYLAYSRLHYPIYFWSSHDGVEVDFFCETTKGFIAAEFKSSARWDKRFSRGLCRIRDELGASNVRLVGVFTGSREARVDGIQILPVVTFLKKLWAKELIT